MEFLNKSVDELKDLGKQKKSEYLTADPFPNMYFDNFFIPEKLKEVLVEFPDLTKNADLKFNDPNGSNSPQKENIGLGTRPGRSCIF